MGPKARTLAILLVALLPSVYLAWSLRDMQHLGFYHDDTLYLVSAKSLATGQGYRIASLPGQPFQTKYPPLYPALLAVIWKLAPPFPANLPYATLFQWLLLPLYVAMVWRFLRKYGLEVGESRLLTAMAALSPVAVIFTFSVMPELLFTALLLASIVLAEQASEQTGRWWLAALAGLCGGLAYLTKSAAMPLLFTAPLCFAFRKQWRNAVLFVAAMAPSLAAWQIWASSQTSKSWDLVTLYYTNYVGFQVYNVPVRDLPLVMWQNLDGMLRGAGKLLLWDVPAGSKNIEWVIAIAAIAGIVRLTRRNRKLQYPIAALGMSGILLIWHYTPDQRFVFPLYPLLLAGLWTEVKNMWSVLLLSWRKATVADRGAVFVGAGMLASLALFITISTGYGLFQFLPDLFNGYRADFETRKPAYQWIAANAPAAAAVFAYDDPLLYLYTGRKACGMPIPTKFFYHNDDAGIDRLLHTIPDFARQYGLDYALLTHADSIATCASTARNI